ncbi:hypothetical protein SAY87_010399 [Trapa incisa]|uniref:Uncharacterized protein n=1 Tax=Trapa incisa TaxID=236973 RepID=A0AAN7GWA5_9MYRT|nr:hypothetical protein SAY87_010399 [Trapa incisa]
MVLPFPFSSHNPGKLYDWPFSISLTMIHMTFCSSLAYLLINVFKVVEPISMSREFYFKSVVSIGALYSLSLWFSNSAYIYLSVSFIQMLKALMLGGLLHWHTL